MSVGQHRRGYPEIVEQNKRRAYSLTAIVLSRIQKRVMPIVITIRLRQVLK